jgi:hypothetical protein
VGLSPVWHREFPKVSFHLLKKGRRSLRRIPRIVAPLFLLCLLAASAAAAQTRADVETVNRLLDRCAALEEAMDMAAHAQLIREDRVWIAQGLGPLPASAATVVLAVFAYHAAMREGKIPLSPGAGG